MNCRHCGADLEHVFLDLGHAPPSNAYRPITQRDSPELTLPLRLLVCEQCWLVQTADFARPGELFGDNYAYFSSVSSSWSEHAARYFEGIRSRLALDNRKFVLEVASNDGYLLRHFVAAGIPCLGVEPTASTAAVAEGMGIPVLRKFFNSELGRELADSGRAADLIIGNNVYAHVPDLNDFTAGLKAALGPNGTITLEFPHLLRMIEETQFDTAYHEHFSYLSLQFVARIFDSVGLRVIDVDELKTHGGSLRVYGSHEDDERPTSPEVSRLVETEDKYGLRALELYRGFQARADRVKDDLLEFLIEQKRAGLNVAAYGAAAKGNTLLNYAGIKADLLPYVCDAAPSKQGMLMPGSHIPILAPSEMLRRKPDIVLILPWNIAPEIMVELGDVRSWGGRFATAVPRLQLH